MAREFIKSSSMYAQNTSAAISGPPCTFAAWVKRRGNGADQAIICVGYDSGSAHYLQLNTRLFNNRVEYWGQGTGTQFGFQVTNDLPAAGTWYHIASRSASSSDHKLYYNGTANTETSTVDAGSFTNLQNTTVGARDMGVVTGYSDAHIADAAIWDTNLTDNEIDALAGGTSPALIRPSNLVCYWPLFGTGSPEPDYGSNKFNLTLTNSPAQSSHAPVAPMNPTRRREKFARISWPILESYTRLETGSVTSITISVPTGTAENDVLFAAVATDGDVVVSPDAGGWTQEINAANGTELNLDVWWRVATASEPSSYSFSWSGNETSCGSMYRFSNIDTTTPVTGKVADGDSTSVITCPSTTSGGGKWTLRLAAADDNDITTDTGMPGGGLFLRETSIGGPHNIAHGAASRARDGELNVGSVSFTMDAAEENLGVTLVLQEPVTEAVVSGLLALLGVGQG